MPANSNNLIARCQGGFDDVALSGVFSATIQIPSYSREYIANKVPTLYVNRISAFAGRIIGPAIQLNETAVTPGIAAA